VILGLIVFVKSIVLTTVMKWMRTVNGVMEINALTVMKRDIGVEIDQNGRRRMSQDRDVFGVEIWATIQEIVPTIREIQVKREAVLTVEKMVTTRENARYHVIGTDSMDEMAAPENHPVCLVLVPQPALYLASQSRS
jgi:uncharacterized protein YuzE